MYGHKEFVLVLKKKNRKKDLLSLKLQPRSSPYDFDLSFFESLQRVEKIGKK